MQSSWIENCYNTNSIQVCVLASVSGQGSISGSWFGSPCTAALHLWKASSSFRIEAPSSGLVRRATISYAIQASCTKGGQTRSFHTVTTPPRYCRVKAAILLLVSQLNTWNILNVFNHSFQILVQFQHIVAGPRKLGERRWLGHLYHRQVYGCHELLGESHEDFSTKQRMGN